MCTNVHLQRAQRCIGFLTIFAREMLLYLRAAMKLFVLGETTKCRITFATAITLITCQILLYELATSTAVAAGARIYGMLVQFVFFIGYIVLV